MMMMPFIVLAETKHGPYYGTNQGHEERIYVRVQPGWLKFGRNKQNNSPPVPRISCCVRKGA
jgi:hypothetical protein